jgi:ribosome-binding factor A
MRPLPRIHFAVDKTESKAAKIDELINNLDKEKE